MPYTDPSPPTIDRIVTGNQTASIYIIDGSANGSGATQAYKYTFDNITYYWASSSTSPIVISSGLVNNQGYKISVATKTAIGMSAYCAQSTTFVPYTLPGAPTITSVVAGNGLAFLYFTDGITNGRPITKYRYAINGVVYPEVTGTSPLLITGLTNGASYTATLTNCNLAGYSPASIASNAFTPFTVPGAPSITNLIPSANQITVYVSPGNTNGSAIKSYSYSLNGGAFVNTASPALSFVITGLTNGTGYTVAIKAVNDAGEGAASATSASVVPYTVPDAPTITGVTVGNNSATITISNGNNNGRIATQYQYTYTSSAGSTTLTTSTSTTQLSSFLITGLTNWTTYTVAVKAINAAGMSPASVVSSSFMPFNIPSAPVIASVVPGNASLLVNMDGLTIGAGVIGYKYSFDNVSYTYISGGGSSFSITNLTNASSYQVYVKSATSQGDSPASMPSSTVVPFSVPNPPTITSVVAGNRTVSITVLDGSNNGRSVTSYEYSTDGVKYNVVDAVSPIVLNNLVNWQSYSYYVRAVNLAGSSLPSGQSPTVVPFLVPPSATIASIIPGDCQLTVTIEGYSPDAGIIGYKYSLDNGPLVFVESLSASFTIPELINGQDYIVRVKSCTTAGDSPLSNPSEPIHPRTIPSVPTNVVVTPLNESASVAFTDGSDNGEPIQYYLYSINGEVDIPIKKREDGTLKIFGISNAVNYSVRLRAVNSAGLSPYSITSNTFMPYSIPLVSPVVTKVLPGNECVYVYFSEADTNGSVLTKFKWSNGTSQMDISGITSPLTISGLANKKPVTISIASCNAVGDSPFTTPVSMIPGVPLVPVITNVVAGPTKLLVYFDVPENNGFPITSYSYSFPGAKAFVKAASASTTSASPLMLLNLKNGTPYDVSIIATNANGVSEVSNSIGPRSPCAPPTKIAITGVTPLIDGGLVAFVEPANNGSAITGYKYALNESTTYIDASGLNLPLRIYGATPNAINTVKVIATNPAGDSLESVASKPFTYVFLPPAQVKITGLTIELNKLTVAFLPPAINGSPIIGYQYALNDSTTFTDISGVALPLVIRDGILPNIMYNVRIIAVNAAGMSVPSLPAAKPVSFVYLPPLAPAITTIVPVNQSATVTFAGQPARGAPITGYAYTLDANAATIVDVSGAVSPLTITGLTNDTLYNVRIAAITPAGYSAWSVAKPVTPVYKVPDMPVITGVVAGSRQLTVAFTAPAANGSPIIGYKYTLNGVDKVEIGTIIGGKSFIITGLTAGTVYNVKMCATNILGDSGLSLGKPGTPKP
jgi:titin